MTLSLEVELEMIDVVRKSNKLKGFECSPNDQRDAFELPGQNRG